jgi:hypothetical protein
MLILTEVTLPVVGDAFLVLALKLILLALVSIRAVGFVGHVCERRNDRM